MSNLAALEYTPVVIKEGPFFGEVADTLYIAKPQETLNLRSTAYSQILTANTDLTGKAETEPISAVELRYIEDSLREIENGKYSVSGPEEGIEEFLSKLER
jgi:hypothetical protein